MARKELPSGDKGHKLSDADRREYIKLIKQHLSEVAHHPVVERNEQGQLSIEFVQFDLDDDYASLLLNLIIDNGGFGLNADTMVMRMQKQSALAATA